VSSLSPDALRQQIASRRASELYLIHGRDEGEKAALAAAFTDLVEPELRAFNVERLYGSDASLKPGDIVDAARTLPMMGNRRVIVVLQADRVLQPKRESEASSDALEVMEQYIQSPLPSTVLVFVTESELNRQRRIARLLFKSAATVECGGLGSTAEAARLVHDRARERGMTVDRAAAQELLARAGGDAAKLRTDVERVLTYVGQGTVTVDAVDEVVSAAEGSEDDWALTRAIEQGRAGQALRELRARLDAGDSVFAILGQVAFAVRQPPPRGRFPAGRVPAAIDALFRTDVALKSSGGDPRVLVERLIVELCG
jgi:DNA polymerase-3 subunit delta